MGNLCSIFHVRFKNLIKVIPSTRKAQLVDYILLGWQSSSYRLKDSELKWFMKPYADIVADTGIPKSTLERYIKELHEKGFIERRQALYSRTKENGSFEVKKGTYIHITDKLLALINTMNSISEPSVPEINIQIESNDKSQQKHSNQNNINPICDKNNINEGTDPLKMRELYIRDLYTSFKNNIILKKTTSLVDKEKSERLFKQMETIHQTLYSKVKEEIPDEVKKIVLGTFYNLTMKHQKEFSNPSQVAAEYLFALINTDYQMPSVGCFKHRNNILSKLIRENKWKTPKGFYNYFYLGQEYKEKETLRELRWQQNKENEMNGIGYEVVDEDSRPSHQVFYETTHPELLKIEDEIYEKGCLLSRLEEEIHKQTTEELICLFREKISTLRETLQALYQQQNALEKEIESQARHRQFNFLKRKKRGLVEF